MPFDLQSLLDSVRRRLNPPPVPLPVPDPGPSEADRIDKVLATKPVYKGPLTPDNLWSRLTDTGNLRELPSALNEQIIQPQVDEFRKAEQDASLGHYSEMAGHGAAALLPGIGPQAAQAGEAFARGDVGGGLKDSALAVGGAVLPGVLGRVMGKVASRFAEGPAADTLPMAGGDRQFTGFRQIAPVEPQTAVGWKEIPADYQEKGIHVQPSTPYAAPGPAPWDALDPYPAVGRSAADVIRENPILKMFASGESVPPPTDTGGSWVPSVRSAADIIRENPTLKPFRTGTLGPDTPVDTGEPITPFSGETASARQMPLSSVPETTVPETLARAREVPRSLPVDETTGPPETSSGKSQLSDMLAQDAQRMYEARNGNTINADFTSEPAPASPIHPIQRLFDKLQPKWAAANASAPDVPFDVPAESFPEFYQRVLTDDPRQLMGAERAVRAQVDPVTADPSGEAGFVDPSTLGPGLKALAPILERVRYASMLSGPTTQAVNIAGNVGAIGARAAEEALTGNLSGAGKVLREFFSPQTLREFRTEWNNPPEGRWGPTTGVLGAPGRLMGAADAAAKDALGRAGISPEEARLITYTNQPKSASGAGLVKFFNDTPLARLVVPFSRTATNIAERGLEHTPGVGMLPWVRAMRPETTLGRSLARQAIGGGAAVGLGMQAKSALARHEHPWAENRVVQALLGPAALPVAATLAAVEKKKAQTPWDNIQSGYNAAIRTLPVTSDTNQFDPRQILASFIPNALRSLSPADSTMFDTTKVPGHPELKPLAPAIAKIPWLNAYLLRQKRARRQ